MYICILHYYDLHLQFYILLYTMKERNVVCILISFWLFWLHDVLLYCVYLYDNLPVYSFLLLLNRLNQANNASGSIGDCLVCHMWKMF